MVIGIIGVATGRKPVNKASFLWMGMTKKMKRDGLDRAPRHISGMKNMGEIAGSPPAPVNTFSGRIHTPRPTH